MSPERRRWSTEPLLAGFAKGRGGKSLADFDVAPAWPSSPRRRRRRVPRAAQASLALYIGGMGARDKNFYNDFTGRSASRKPPQKIQDLYLAGKRDEAMAAVPDALVDAVSLVGSPDRIKDRLQAWKEAGKTHAVGSMLLSGVTVNSLRVVAEAVLYGDVSGGPDRGRGGIPDLFHGGLHCYGRGYGLALAGTRHMSAPVTRLTSVMKSYGRLIAACALPINSSVRAGA